MLAPNRRFFAELRYFPLLGMALTAAMLSACLREPLESRGSKESRASKVDANNQQTASDLGVRPAGAAPTEDHGVLLAGTFEQVAKKVSGSVTLERNGDTYELVVRDVTLTDVGPVHVYFIGLPQVRSSMDLDGVDAKYDFGPLEETGSGAYVAVHRVKLPSEPKPELRSVALINPRFGVVLASSSLKKPD